MLFLGKQPPLLSALRPADLVDGTQGFRIFGTRRNQRIGQDVDTVGDINGDGYDDIILNSPQHIIYGQPSFTATPVIAVSNLNGINGFSTTSGLTNSQLGDVNGDGVDDFLIGNLNAGGRAGEFYVVFGNDSGFHSPFNPRTLDGTNGFTINGIDAGDQTYNFIDISSSAAGDFNGDGLDDIIINARSANGGTGEVYLIYGSTNFSATFDLISLDNTSGHIIAGIDPGDSAGASIFGLGDVNGDGFDDIGIGAYNADPNEINNAGEGYVIFGYTGSTTAILGTDAGETLTGTASGDNIIAGQGNDTIEGNGGQDVLYAGQGDDIFDIIDSTFFRIDGGSGTDTLVWNASGTLDLTAIEANRLENIEVLDLSTNTGDVIINLREVLDISSTSNNLVIDGDSNNTVNLLDTGDWTLTQGGLVQGASIYDVYSNGVGTLQVDQNVVIV